MLDFILCKCYIQFVGESEFKKTVAKNIVKHRKRLGLTQFELAEKLNYTDKSVSKWERGETLPDAFVLKQLADLFGITVDDFTIESDGIFKKLNIKSLIKNRIAVSVLSVLFNFFIATVIFFCLSFFEAPVPNKWMVFIYAIVSASIIMIVFSSLWWKRLVNAICISALNWSLALSLFLSTLRFNDKAGLFFLIAGIFEVIIITWFSFFGRKKNKH